ncbi:inc metabolism membrane protein [Dispira simplex]|nr:inc metabolism membrane protein [Dispira simplex]
MTVQTHFPFPRTYVDSAILERLEKAFHLIESQYKLVDATSTGKETDTARWCCTPQPHSLINRGHKVPQDRCITSNEESSDDDSTELIATATGTLAEKADAVVAILEDWLGELETQSLHQCYATIQYVENRYAELSSMDSFRLRIDTVLGQVEQRFYQAGSSTRDATLVATRAMFHGARRLLRFDELPREWQENEFIVSGYRFLTTSPQCLQSIFQYHNETGNIWTHLLGLVFFVILGLYEVFYRLPAQATQLVASQGLTNDAIWTTGMIPTDTDYYAEILWVDRLIFLCFFFAACKCLLCSTMYHTFCHHSHLSTMRCAVMLDYIGISVLITASIIPVSYYGFYCDPASCTFYTIFTLLVGTTGTILSSFPWFDRSEYRYVRVIVFVLMGASGAIPMLHLAYDRGLVATSHYIAPIVKSLCCYLVGVYFYANKYPERLYPGLFDHLGNSHQIWHLSVIGGIFFHYMATLHFYQSRHVFGCMA